MMDEYKVNEEGLTKDGYRRLEPRSKKAMYVRNAIAFVIWTAIMVSCCVLIHRYDGYASSTTDIVFLAIYAVVVIYLIVGPRIFYDHYRYRIDEDKVEVRRGIIIFRHVLVPIERIHQVEVKKGPVRRMFGLADVNITTAGGVASIEYLEDPVAEDIASKLNECVVEILKDRE